MGGLFSIFHQKSASKAPKTCDFAYFTSQWGGYRPPPAPPGYATALCTIFIGRMHNSKGKRAHRLQSSKLTLETKKDTK